MKEAGGMDLLGEGWTTEVYAFDKIIIDHHYWVIDWMTANAGNPACDVARSLQILTMSASPPGLPMSMRLLSMTARRVLSALYLHSYPCVIGRRKAEVRRWYLPVAIARLTEGNPEEESGRFL